MFPRRSWELALPLAGLIAVGVMTGSASAATTQSFNCRASVVRVTALSGSPLTIEPYIANPTGGALCATDSDGVTGTQTVNLGVLAGVLGNNLTVGPAQAATTSTVSSTSLGAGASTTVQAVSVPTPAGTISIAGPAQATAGYSCGVNGAVVETNSSSLSAAQVGSTNVTLSSPGMPYTMPLTSLTSGLQIGTLTLNQNTATATSNTETLATINLTGIASIVIGEATVAQPASGACSSLVPTPPPTTPTVTVTTPTTTTVTTPTTTTTTTPTTTISRTTTTTTTTQSGSSDSSSSSSSQTSAGTLADVARDVSGGRVYTLAQARHKFRSACLKGGGSKWVVVGTKGRNRITVRKYAVRVLALGGNDTVTVRGGNGTCVDGGAGRDRIVNLGTNRVKVYGGAGSDQIRLGNGAASVSGGAGANTITAGTGRDVIVVGHGRNRVTARGAHVLVRAGRGRTVAYLQRANIAYARRHGVHTVHLL